MIPLVAFLAIIPLGTLAEITCPDSTKCPDNSTCCAWSSAAGYGCCPVLGGVCCKKDFCCDVGEICENHLKICINSLFTSKGHLAFIESYKGKFKDIPCSGSSTGSCPDNDTCCQGGCCPLPNAVCCSDGEHCCPQNTVCDVSAGLCLGSKGSLPSIKTRKSKDIPCSGSSTGSCPDSDTCCQGGCCPLPNAVCCSDGEHCCPQNTVCDVSAGLCLGSKGSMPSLKTRKPKDIPCSGSSTGSCPDNDTCCQGGCCPLPNAVCCSDGEHCCPQNTVCDVSAGLCIGSNGDLFRVQPKKVGNIRQIEILKPALAVGVKVVYCPGGQYYCPDYSTCCLLPTGQWGCCPYPSAVCCPDKVHCCPAGTHCDATSTQCLTSESGTISASRKFLAKVLGKH